MAFKLRTHHMDSKAYELLVNPGAVLGLVHGDHAGSCELSGAPELGVLRTSTAGTAGDNRSPITNLQLDSRKRMLTWNYIRNVSQQECMISTPPNSPTMPSFSTTQAPKVREDSTYFCIFRNRVLHRGANLTVRVTCDGAKFQEVLLFANPGREGSGAMNFSCFIYNVRLMNCSWAPGPRAPADVCYRLFWHEDEAECVHYVTDPTGTRVGCHFDELGEPQGMDNYFFLLNGTSSETAIPFLDFVPFEARKIEKYDPPTNIMIAHNTSHHIIRWENPEMRYELSTQVLYYELDIQRPGSASKTNPVLQRGQDSNVYVVPRSAVRPDTTLRLRVRYVHNELWSEWSPTLRLGLPEDFPGALVGVLVAASAVPALVLVCFCKWYSLFPRIPQVKKELTGTLFSPEGPSMAQQVAELCSVRGLVTFPHMHWREKVSTLRPQGTMQLCTGTFWAAPRGSRTWVPSTLPDFCLPGVLGRGPPAAELPGARRHPHRGGHVVTCVASASPRVPRLPGKCHAGALHAYVWGRCLPRPPPLPPKTQAFWLHAGVHTGAAVGI
ncbi:granulocyte-macrophage colony-stimulating factor receptor subunit alpha isoform X3 [Mustela putorius furo]|uniref:Granulocyte-macrophage colony-stimulating factor receptor subunit alpha isoform X3 n=1 Tax=Mustela putorius furo TaxID=9669 RepID=A0A8U0P066_MUSPF|nr:granulocyte-macrophage colony-stimulating factor receptor subunit alpha isoform X3 [Mustela putorius furo]